PPTAHVALLRDVGKLLAEGLARVGVAVERELAGGDVGAHFETRAGQVFPGDADGRRVLPVDVADHVRRPAEAGAALTEVDARFELGLARSLTAPDPAAHVGPGALEHREL